MLYKHEKNGDKKMSDLYTNMVREIKILRYAAENKYNVVSQFVDGSKVMFTVEEKHLEPMKKFCIDNFGSCNEVEKVGSVIMCRVD